MSFNIFQRFLSLLPTKAIFYGKVTSLYPDQQCQVTLPGNAVVVVRTGATAVVVNDSVYIQDGQVLGKAPALPEVDLII
jgi:hypothetical protein